MSAIAKLSGGRLPLNAAGFAMLSGAPGVLTAASRALGRVTFGPNLYGVVAPNLSLAASTALSRTWAQPWSSLALIDTTGMGDAGTTPSTGAGIVWTDSRAAGSAYTGPEQWADYLGKFTVRVIGNFGEGNFIDARCPNGINDLSPAGEHWIGASYDGSGSWTGIRQYIDGVRQVLHSATAAEVGGTAAPTSLTGTPNASSGPRCIGNQLDGYLSTFYLPGSMRGIAFSSIQQPDSWFAPRASNIPAIDSTIMGAWDFSATSGATVPDASGNGNVITLASSSMFSRT